MSAHFLKQTRIQILLSLNAVALLIAGVLIAGAIWLPKKSFHVVSERSDDVAVEESEAGLFDPVSDFLDAITGNGDSGSYSPAATNSASTDPVPNGELWAETSKTIYESADIDLCVSGSLSNLGDMYWQTSDTSVISGFYSEARTKLGYDTEHCRYPKIVGTGTVTVTAGTYDGERRDTLTVTVISVPAEEWKREILTLVNDERKKAGLDALTWGNSCESASQTRAKEIMTNYDHTRPNGTSWQTACPIPSSGGTAGENVAAGSSTASPRLVMTAWMNSESHRENILNKNYTKMSVGFVFDPSSKYKTYWEQFFSTY